VLYIVDPRGGEIIDDNARPAEDLIPIMPEGGARPEGIIKRFRG
jgi:hypothetical protein